MSALLENKIWKVQLPKDKQYAMEMEFRSAGWRTTFLYDEKQTKTFYSYSLHGDTIKVFESGKNCIIQELTDSTLTFLYLPESLTIGVAPVRCTTDNSIQGLRENEKRLDSIWRKEDIWNKGTAPINKTQAIKEYPRWAVWDYDLEKYFVSQMKYPKELLKKNVAGHSVVMFSIDTLGLPREINILTTIHKEFDKEIIRLTLKSATKLFSVLLASKRPLITELADKLRLKYPLLPTISPCPTMRLEAIRSIIPISCRRYPKSV